MRIGFLALWVLAGCAGSPAETRASIEPALEPRVTARGPSPGLLAEVGRVDRLAAEVDRLILRQRELGPPSPGTALAQAAFRRDVAALETRVATVLADGGITFPAALERLEASVTEPLERLQGE